LCVSTGSPFRWLMDTSVFILGVTVFVVFIRVFIYSSVLIDKYYSQVMHRELLTYDLPSELFLSLSFEPSNTDLLVPKEAATEPKELVVAEFVEVLLLLPNDDAAVLLLPPKLAVLPKVAVGPKIPDPFPSQEGTAFSVLKDCDKEEEELGGFNHEGASPKLTFSLLVHCVLLWFRFPPILLLSSTFDLFVAKSAFSVIFSLSIFLKGCVAKNRLAEIYTQLHLFISKSFHLQVFTKVPFIMLHFNYCPKFKLTFPRNNVFSGRNM
jgi:hypothetical protein